MVKTVLFLYLYVIFRIYKYKVVSKINFVRILIFSRGQIVSRREFLSAAQTDKPVTALVYPEGDASFTLYQDAGDGYAFEQGDYAVATLLWDDSRQKFEVKTKGFPREIHYECIDVN